MAPKNLFWFSSTVACVGTAVSAIYFMLVYIPSRDRLQAQTAAENARIIRFSQLETECANRARPAAQEFMLEQRAITGRGFEFQGFSNHYNRKLQKCIVEVDTLSSGPHGYSSGRYFVDAYENTILMSCNAFTPHDPKSKSEFHCEDADLVRIPPEQEDKRLKALMTE
jgi:hypothetical protein